MTYLIRIIIYTQLYIYHNPLGIHEKWKESVERFHKLFGGKLFSDELVNHRASKSLAASRVHQLINIMKTHSSHHQYIDPWDTALYKHALNVFHSKL